VTVDVNGQQTVILELEACEFLGHHRFG